MQEGAARRTGIAAAQVEQCEEEERARPGDGAEDVALAVEGGRQLGRLDELLLDRLRGRLERVERVDELLVLEQVALGRRELLEQLLLHPLELDLELVLRREQRRLLRLELGLLVLDGHA